MQKTILLSMILIGAFGFSSNAQDCCAGPNDHPYIEIQVPEQISHADIVSDLKSTFAVKTINMAPPARTRLDIGKRATSPIPISHLRLSSEFRSAK